MNKRQRWRKYEGIREVKIRRRKGNKRDEKGRGENRKGEKGEGKGNYLLLREETRKKRRETGNEKWQ